MEARWRQVTTITEVLHPIPLPCQPHCLIHHIIIMRNLDTKKVNLAKYSTFTMLTSSMFKYQLKCAPTISPYPHSVDNLNIGDGRVMIFVLKYLDNESLCIIELCLL